MNTSSVALLAKRKKNNDDDLTTYYLIYHTLIFAALSLSLLAYWRGHAHCRYLAWLLTATLAVELLAEFLLKYELKFVWAYHIYVVIEYSLLCFYYSVTPGSQHKWSVRQSVPIFLLFSLSVSIFVYQFQSFPGININVSGLILFVLYTHVLFNLDVDQNITLFRHPDFWIAIGILLFFGGTFLFNAIYWPYVKSNEKKALQLFAIINKPLNLLLYGCITFGLLCSIPTKK